MKFKVSILLFTLVFLLGASACAQDEWIPEDIESPLVITPDWNEPDSPLLAMTREDGLIYMEDIDEPVREFLKTRARCIFESLRPSQLMQRLTWVTDLDLREYKGTLTDARWLWMFNSESIVSLAINDATISNLSVIGDFTMLEELSLINCGIFDLTPLTNCTHLTTLSLGWDDEYLGEMGVFDLAPLASLKRLKNVALYGTGFQSLDALAKNARRYRQMTFSDTAITDFSLLSKFSNLDAVTVDLLHTNTTSELLLACPRGIDELTLKQLILDSELLETLPRFKSLKDYSLIDCDVSDSLFYENLNKSTRLTLQSISMPNGEFIGEIYADKTNMILRDVPEAVMISILNNRSTRLQTLSIDIGTITEQLSEALSAKTSITDLTVTLTADLDLTCDAWKRITGVRDMTIASKGYTLANTNLFDDLFRIQTLTLSGVAVADTAGMAHLENMSQLNVFGSRVTDWSFLSELKAVTIIKVYGSELENSALSWFAGLRALDELRIDGNNITDLSALLASETIRKLSVLDNPIEDYTVILKMPAVRMVYLDQGGIITDNHILARSQSYDNIDYNTIWQEAFGTEEAEK